MSGEALLGIDVGTTATKATVALPDGQVLAEATRDATLHSPHATWAEEDPGQWWENVAALVPEVLEAAGVDRDALAAVGVSGMVPTLICADADSVPLRPSIQQSDARATREIAELAEELADADLLERTGSTLSAQSVGPKLRWLARTEPDVLAATRWIGGSYDWVVHRLTGASGLEANWALESGLYDLREEAWADDVCAALDVDRVLDNRPLLGRQGLLGAVHRSHEVVGEVTRAAAEHTGLRAGTPVVAGAADHIASAFSAGIRHEGDLLVKLGGAGDIMLSVDRPVVDARVFLDHHLVPDLWMPNGCMASSGSVLKWFQRELAGGIDFEALDRKAEGVPPGSDGLICLPYFLGEKSPINDPRARGSFVGLHLGHTRAHLYRAALEGIAFGFAHHVEVFNEQGLRTSRVRVTNGGSRSRLWRQIVADVLDQPLESLVDHPGSSLGAAFVAGVGVDLLDWSDVDRFITVDEVVEPRADAVTHYRDSYAVYRSLYPALRQASHALADAQAEQDGRQAQEEGA